MVSGGDKPLVNAPETCMIALRVAGVASDASDCRGVSGLAAPQVMEGIAVDIPGCRETCPTPGPEGVDNES